MKNTDKRVDAYIMNAADFAQPILIHLRSLIHAACPQVQETMKWSFPHFVYKGETLCSFASFKHHCAFGFWKATLLQDPKNVLQKKDREAMGHLGKISSVKDLPSQKVLIGLIAQAMKLNDLGIKLPAKEKKPVKEPAAPAWFLKELKKDKTAFKHWSAFTPGKRKEYVVWLTEAKTEETRLKRMDQALDWISEGKSRNWKYEQKLR